MGELREMVLRDTTGERVIDMRGRRLGKLLVIGPAPSLDGSARWRCACDCGATITRIGSVLRRSERRGNAISCGDCPAPPETMRWCGQCHTVKPLAPGHFEVRRYGHLQGLHFRNTCRECIRKQKRVTDRQRAQRCASLEQKSGKNCQLCEGLSWRIVGPKCRCCGELYADEPPVELVFRRHYERTCP